MHFLSSLFDPSQRFEPWAIMQILPLASIFLALTGCGSSSSSNRSSHLSSVSSYDAAVTKNSSSEGQIELRVVKLPQLMKDIESQRGKIVVVDFWADFCLPCKKNFPHLVHLHQLYARDGVVCMSVSLDGAESHDAALAFLKKNKATFANYRLDEEPNAWQDKWDIAGPPLILVYDRGGKLARKFATDPDTTYEIQDVEKLVKKLLQEK